MVYLADQDAYTLVQLARQAAAREGIALPRAYHREAARLLAEKLAEARRGIETDGGTRATVTGSPTYQDVSIALAECQRRIKVLEEALAGFQKTAENALA